MLDEGSRRRLEGAYREYGAEVWRAIYAYSGGSRHIADEAVAEAFAQAGRGLDRIRDLRPWLFRAAFKIAAGELKQRPAPSLRPPAPQDGQGMMELLDLARSLTSAQRRAFALRDVLGFSSREAAKLMGTSEVAVRVHLHAAHRRLRALVLEAES
ncbi:MAG TPA: RNA polymerase sigma factor [Actinomycetota bacterium]|nr:RNA polymerase sigma factor [Actinomycetota bacterium]